MKKIFTLSTWILLSILFVCPLTAQETMVWPGDASNNGVADEADLIYWARAYGIKRFERPASSINWVGQPATPIWPDTFPSGINFAHTDMDGDGRVSGRDLQALMTNLHRTHAPAEQTDPWVLPDTSGNHEAVLRLMPAGIQLRPEGSVLLLDVVINGREGSFEDFHSLSLRATVSPGLLADYQNLAPELEQAALVSGKELFTLAGVDSSAHQLSFSVTAINHEDRPVNGAIARMKLPLAADFEADSFGTAQIIVDSLIFVDSDFTPHSLATSPLDLNTDAGCSFSVNPVCGSNGVTYLNSCFAEAAGITVYTSGACWNPGLSVENMNAETQCPTAYEPVCGFNGVTYGNACEAEAAGVLNYYSGLCDQNAQDCYDPGLIVISSGTSVNQVTGVITLTCEPGSLPVCGCDGEQYASACMAEASGVRSYTTGGCDDNCVNPAQIANTDDCESNTDFVCGCNGETYINSCFADAAGVLSYTPGPCNGSSGWCDEATVISCGDYLPNETTIGAGNQITSYPGATGALMQGPDRVYVFEKSSAGDLQVGLEIMTPGLNMDLFLLTGDCGNYTVVGSSTYSNNATNNEGIVLEDAPNGTYYIIVDQGAAGIGGNYRLELSCGYLDCSQRVPLSCGTPYNGTNAGGTDDVSTYTCGPQLNVENNGPEIVHTFTTTESGLVTIDLTNLSANLELFLLSECSRRSCLQYSQNSGTSSEQIVRNLPAGTYYVVVDGYNGAISNYNLTVDCSSSCDLDLQMLGQTGTACGQSGGSITFAVTGGSPTYTAHYVGPVCRAASSYNGQFYFGNLPPGDYVTTIEDASGCEMVFNFTIYNNNGGMNGTMTPTAAGCGEEGRIDVSLLTTGVAPYTVYLSGDLNRVFTTSSANFVITPLEAGNYTVSVVDAAGCSFSESVTIDAAGGNLDVEAWAEPAGCDGSMGEIVVRAPNGTLPYSISLSGPVTGGATVNGYNFRLRSLPAGAYVFTLTDAFGCSYTETLVVANGDMEVSVSPTAANCALPGAARVNISAGTAPYTINYTGPVSGTINTNEQITVINDLPAGTYNFSIWAADGCDVAETIFVEDNGGNLDFTVNQMIAACDGNNSGLQLTVTGGTPNYTVVYSGTVSGSTTLDGTGTGWVELPPGTYTFTATDFGNCSATTEMTVNGGLSSANQSSFATGAGCGQLDNIRTLLSGGEAPFSVTVTTDACPEENRTFTTLDHVFDLTDLPNCTYTIEVTDANDCFSSQTVSINVNPDDDILILTALDGACGGTGIIDLEVTAGEYPYFIDWTGPVDGNVNLASQTYRVSDLPAGTYVFSLTNADGCEATETITLLNDGSLEVVSSVVTDECGAPDQIWNDIEGGAGPYTVEVIRLCDDTQVDVVVSGNGFEVVDLIPCDYKISVTDVNGCMTMRTVTVEPYQLFNTIATDGVCGQSGTLDVMVMNSFATGPYSLSYSGPSNGIQASNTGVFNLTGLPAGTYTLVVTDANGCSETETATLTNVPSDLDLQTALINNDCGQYNQLWNDINGGTGPFQVEVIRLCDGVTDTSFVLSGNGFELIDLEACCYSIAVTDAMGCTVMTESCVEDPSANLFTVTPVSGPCGENGRVDLSFIRGTAPYQVDYSGPQSGSNTVNGNILSINDAPAGEYTIMVTDANGCEETETVVLEGTTSNLVLQAALISNDCEQYNQVWIDIFNGTGPFSVEVIRLCDSTTMTQFVSGEVGFELTELAPCDYKIIVTDAAGCMVMDVITVFPAPIDLYNLTAVSGECNEPGSFDLQITRGRAPYTIVYDGPVSDSLVTDQTSLSREDLPSGDYTFFVTDSLGCIETNQFTIQNTTSDLDLVTSLIFNDCNQLNQLWNDIEGGTAPFNVEVTRLCDGTIDTTFTTNETQFELDNRTPCEYAITVTDATGCTDAETIVVQGTSANLFDVAINNSCDSSGFFLDFIAGTGPYRIAMSGPVTRIYEDIDGPLYIPAPAGDYAIRAFSAEGCMEMNFSSIIGGGSGELAEIGFATSMDGLAVNFTNQSGPGDYSWDFGDGTAVVTDANPQHIYADAGTYQVCLTAANGCGSNTACQTVDVNSTGSAQIIIGGAQSFPGGSVSIPVSIQGTDNIATIAGTFALDNPSLATITHLSAGAIAPQFNADNSSFSFVANGTEGVTLGGNIDVLFFIHLQLGNNPGETELELINQPIELEVSAVRSGVPILVPVTYLPGFVEVSSSIVGNISSQAMTPDNNEVEGTTFQLSEPDGGFTIDLPVNQEGIATTIAGLSMGRMYYIEPLKTSDYANGLSSFEIFLTQRYLLGYDVPQITDPMQVVAMDMNCSQSVSTIDLYLMQRLLLNDDLTEVAGCNSWTFVPDSHIFADDWNENGVFPAPRRAEVMLESDTMVMFTGVKTGDILNSADPGRSMGDLPLNVRLPEVFNAGQTYELTLSLAETRNLVSFQSEFKVAEGLEILSVLPGELSEAEIGDHLSSRGLFRMSWFSETGEMRALNAGAEMVKLTVRATATRRSAAGDISVNKEAAFSSEGHDATFQRFVPTVNNLTNTEAVSAFRFLSAAPNPAAEYVDIRFELPQTDETELKLFDALGREVIYRTQTLTGGTQRFRLDTRALAAGAYHFQLVAGGEAATGKLIIRR
ncbi:T9SS type A sorting domain-containing protein [Neolewinella aurantiaca]|uniref:T9SS type A sorting domain-containing protein n=1 Tax=Neolewinella aurantiaca TaxID=2602767 RepID=A0A5C7FP45_9BACT|nr:T9SS type A sorting domain-containing protein [Neolewinella aurantiaca]TXF89423.1 T9SS type A sorting domain-containing protein [Neolewinella aurantiaca]